MKYEAKLGVWEGCVAVLLDASGYELLRSAGTGGRVDVVLEGDENMLLVGLNANPDGELTLTATEGRQSLPYMVRGAVARYPKKLQEVFSRSRLMGFEMEGTWRSLMGEIALLPHLRPWPRLRPNKGYDVGVRAVEVYVDRLNSAVQADDEWVIPPKHFFDVCPSSFMDLWQKMPVGSKLKFPDGQVHERVLA